MSSSLGLFTPPFEFFQKRGPHKVGDANKFMPRCALNFEEHGVRYAGLDRSAVGSRKYFTALALSKGVGRHIHLSVNLFVEVKVCSLKTKFVS